MTAAGGPQEIARVAAEAGAKKSHRTWDKVLANGWPASPRARLGESPWQTFLRAVGCNWLVCLAVWMSLAAKDVAGKILAIFFPIMAFVAMGFDHVVATSYWYLFLKDTPADEPTPADAESPERS